MTNEREPLWSDARISAKAQEIIVLGHTPLGAIRRVAYEIRDDYEARIAELEAQLAQRWEPLPDGEYRSVADILGTFSVFGNGLADAYPVIRQGNNIVMLDMGDAVCRLVTKGAENE